MIKNINGMENVCIAIKSTHKTYTATKSNKALMSLAGMQTLNVQNNDDD